jgi:hypothetical protein
VPLEALFTSPWWADFYSREVLELHAAAERDGNEVDISMSVVCQGATWAIVSLPCELFVEYASEIQRKSPFKHTVCNTLANGYNGYLPTLEAFTRSGGYETKLLSSSFLAPEAGGLVVSQAVLLLYRAYALATSRFG